jgi:hypothetical protein
METARVDADILSQYRQLALSPRARGRTEAALAGASHPNKRAPLLCAYQLYETAAAELDDIIADLMDTDARPTAEAGRPSASIVPDGGWGSVRA